MSTIPDKPPFKFLDILYKKEFILFIVLVSILILNSNISPYFLDLYNLIDSTFLFSEKAIIALTMTFVIIARQIDLSVASIIAVSSCVLGYTTSLGYDTWLVISFTLLGALCGAFNGAIITKFAIPSIIVTIGTMSLFRGLAYSFLEDSYYNKFPKLVSNLGSGYLFGYIPYAFLTFLLLSLVFAFILHKTSVGKKIYSIGNNPDAAQYTGIAVDKYTFVLFTLNGVFSAIAAIFLAGRLSSVRPNIAFGWELEIITMVVLGGVYIYGGSGSILGVVISIFILGMLSFGLGLLNVPGVGIIIFTGLLLILSIGFPSFVRTIRRKNE
jgi:rhamnose transport system permease protein